jgi:hypothetical protein
MMSQLAANAEYCPVQSATAAATTASANMASRGRNISVNAVAPSRCRLRPGWTPALIRHNRNTVRQAPRKTFRSFGSVNRGQKARSAISANNASAMAQVAMSQAGGI